MARGHERWVLYRLAVREAVRTMRSAVARITAPPDLLAGARVTALVIAPHDLRTSDATFADDIYSGLFVFAGRALSVSGRSPFDYEPPSPEWAEVLYGFGWLRHLRAADTALARANARAFVSDFLANRGDAALARPVPIAARRLISFLCQSPLVLEGADHTFYQAFLKSIGRSARDLERALRRGTERPSRLLAAVALCYAGLCCEGLQPILRRATRVLSRELDRQILPDGGHRSRNARFAVELLLDLLPLRQSFLSRSLEPPEALLRAIDRMLPMLRLMRHPDASLSHFNGMGTTEADHLTTLLIYDGALVETMRHAPFSGYERLEGGRVVLVVDVGAPPRQSYSKLACAGCLSFELSSGLQRLVVNCGAPASGTDQRSISRSTAAHSTATIADASSCRFLTGEDGWWGRRLIGRWLLRRWGPIILRGPSPVAIDRRNEPGRAILAGRHDGYQYPFGVTHERRWELSTDGNRLDGEDAFFREGRGRGRARDVAIRFHLHPTVNVQGGDDGRLVLMTPLGGTWTFSSEGAEVAIENSVFFAGVAGPRRSSQIVLHLTVTEGAHVRWQFDHQEPAAA
ncbi:heparinase II/III family protein [Methylobacterium brachythecii]|uniref:Heparinase n=1 Tax=Methylobacterium brachythecii TaxID=1176177 RepID=A0A7W6AKE2_9HYPH|nr:heparinase II/III family protein [Methylobacterium brachythecii]MBB3904273.1 putative heparinase superfamily protein [Methylobacterium brachythecii]GLS46203.1 heparinase [Methylobacterium brachythecii]